MMKKIAVLFLVLLLAMGVTACGAKDEEVQRNISQMV